VASRKRQPSTPTGRDEGGFTLIELLVTVLVLGVLTAIAIPTYLSQRQGAQDTTAKALLTTAFTAAEQYYLENNAYAPDASSLAAIQPVVAWRHSGGPVSLDQDAYVGQVHFERVGTNTWTSGTRSRSGRCFYLVTRRSGASQGNFRLRNTICGDPWSYQSTTSTTW